MKSKSYIFLILLIIFIFFLPIVISPAKLTAKDNDTGRIVIPMFSFLKSSLFNYGQIPLWRSDQLMGETYVGNPISQLLYPGNILFLILPVNIGVVVYFLADLFLASIFTFFLARSFGITKQSSFAAALFYGLSTKMLVHVEAGHVNIITAFAFAPLSFLSLRKLILKTSFFHLVVGAVSLTFMYITFPTIFYYVSIFLVIYWLYKSPFHLSPLVMLLALTFGLSAIALIPQLEFSSLSTRSSLKLEEIAIPLWNFKKFLVNLLFPYLAQHRVDQEEFLYLGLVPMSLALIGFFCLKKNQKIILIAFSLIIALIIAGLSTPFFKLAYELIPLFKYSRVTTRVWFIIALLVALLAALALDKVKNKKITNLLIFVFIVETAFIFYSRLSVSPALSHNNEEIYKHLADDNDIFRVYCTSSCFNVQKLQEYGIQTLNGENPLQQKDFIDFLSSAGNYKYEHFAVIFPPYQVWQTSNPPVPNAELLGQANVKYVASTYPLQSDDFTKDNKYGDIYLYKNEKFRPRAYFLDSNDTVEVKAYSPNKVSLIFSTSSQPRTLIFAENYYPGWVANVDHIKLNVEPYGVFRKIVVPANYEDLDIKFQPKTYAFGKTVTLATISFLVIYYFKSRKRKISQKQ
ncbi:MAG: YfhO family protein [Candidatus Curtissbacteria bacterium]|nr:YfhO family protein [Candidatus Curtissbacteria bacterium]